jgi:IQ domain-containing protein H
LDDGNTGNTFLTALGNNQILTSQPA